MKAGDRQLRTIWLEAGTVRVIDQRRLPFAIEIETITEIADMARAISEMHVRGAGLIGAAAGYGMYLAARSAAAQNWREDLERAAELLLATRPTARNLAWAVERQRRIAEAAGREKAGMGGSEPAAAAGSGEIGADEEREAVIAALRSEAEQIADEDVAACRAIGEHGADLLEALAAGAEGRPLNVLTHCNAGWLAFVDLGTATAPLYLARDRGVALHVWVDETRPWNQGSRLTAWELGQEGIPHTIVADSAGGYLMQQGLVDLVITGADRVTVSGHVANKIGTYTTAVTAADSGVPFYVAFPTSTFDPTALGPEDIVIEERDGEEVLTARGCAVDGPPAGPDTGLPAGPNAGRPAVQDTEPITVRLAPPDSTAANPAFDITPPRLITGYLTERGLLAPGPDSLAPLLV